MSRCYFQLVGDVLMVNYIIKLEGSPGRAQCLVEVWLV